MFVYTNKNNEIIAVTEKDILDKNSYYKKYELEKDSEIPSDNISLYVFDGKKFELKRDAINNLKKQIVSRLLHIQKDRLSSIINKHGYIDLSDVIFYASNDDKEAIDILSWYKEYDDRIWEWIDNELEKITSIDKLTSLNIKQIEETIYSKSLCKIDI